jgi:hypothetical protein
MVSRDCDLWSLKLNNIIPDSFTLPYLITKFLHTVSYNQMFLLIFARYNLLQYG